MTVSPTSAPQWRRGPDASSSVPPRNLGVALASKAARVVCVTSLLAASGFGALAFDELATTPIIVVPPIPRPGYLQAMTDVLFGTAFTRVTDPGQFLCDARQCIIHLVKDILILVKTLLI